MSVEVVGLGYAALGLVIAATLALTRGVTAVDALLLIALWPLYAPLALLGIARTDGAADLAAAVAATLADAATTPLAARLPGPAARHALDATLRAALRRRGELDALLDHPAQDPAAAHAEAAALAARGVTAAAAAARHRARDLEQLHALRHRHRATLDEIAELRGQLASQVELLRLRPALAPTSAGVVEALVASVTALGDLDAVK